MMGFDEHSGKEKEFGHDEDPMNKAIRQDRELMGKLPCGHDPHIDYDVDHHMSNRLDGGREVTDYCVECGWESPYRKQATAVNNAAAERGQSDTELVKWVHESRCGEIGFDNDAMTKLFELAIRSSLRYGREEALRERLKEMSQ